MNTSGLPTISHADGVRLWDVEGVDYIDGSSGVLNMNLGHRPRTVVDAMVDQLQRVTFVHRTQFDSRPLTELTEGLLAIAPPGVSHVEYTNSGSEANEVALRLALAHHHRRGRPERTMVLSEHPGYHGMTAGALGITGQPAKRDPSAEPLAHNDTAAEPVRPSAGRLRADAVDWAAALDRAGRDRVAAVVVEPVGGSATGAASVDPETLRWLRREADRSGFLLVVDEVMSGFGRTGRWWACDHADVAPDLLTSGKGLTCGLTSLAVTFVADRVVRSLAPSAVGDVVRGHTMSGNPLAAATSRAVLEQLRELDVPRRAAARGRRLRAGLEELASRHPTLAEVRGRGLMLALGVVGDADRPLAASKELVTAARRAGLVLCPGGSGAATESVMVAPPLTVTDDEIDELLGRLETAVGRTEAPQESVVHA